MAEHIVEAGVRELLHFFRIPLVDVLERVLLPLRLDFRRVVSPAAQEMHRADDVVKIVILEDVAYLRLVLEVTDLDADLDAMLLLQLVHEGEVLVERVLELVALEPLLLERADERIIEYEVFIVKVLEFRERV